MTQVISDHSRVILFLNKYFIKILQSLLIAYEFRIRRSRKSSRRDLNIIINREASYFGNRLKSLRGPTFEYFFIMATNDDSWALQATTSTTN